MPNSVSDLSPRGCPREPCPPLACLGPSTCVLAAPGQEDTYEADCWVAESGGWAASCSAGPPHPHSHPGAVSPIVVSSAPLLP